MRKVIFLMFLVLGMIKNINAQQTGNQPKSESKAVEFSNRSGSLITKTFYPLGKVGGLVGVDFSLLELKDEIKQEKIVCLRVEVEDILSSVKDTYVGTLDSDEISACIKSLEFMKENLIPTKPVEYVESCFTSRDGVEFGVYSTKNGWSVFCSPQKHLSNSTRRLKGELLDEFIAKLKEASEKMKSL